jgi:hypothetical protein
MGKMLKDADVLNQYKLSNMSIVQALISTPLVRPEGAKPADGQIQTTDDRTGFDKFLRMRNKQYTDLKVHQMRLTFHSIMMRSGVEKTDETADGLLHNEEKWLNGELPEDDSLINLLNRKTVLSKRNDIVLPVNDMQNEPIIDPSKFDIFGLVLFTIIGMILPFISIFLFVLIIKVNVSKTKGIVMGNIIV